MDIRKWKAVSLETKRTIIVLIELKHKTQMEMMREFGLSKSTVNTIWKERGKYLAKTHTFGNDTKRLRNATFDEIEDTFVAETSKITWGHSCHRTWPQGFPMQRWFA